MLRGGYQTQVHSDQMVLVIVRWEAGPRERWSKMFKGELEINSRKPRDLFRTARVGIFPRSSLLGAGQVGFWEFGKGGSTG
jgi:hypothetical protein